mmetsp:Transcript_37363/g.104877  ORF Transcript_37363/g.104877 Transcript_37363/m.104877 type:complete len:414 (-) Transcript_37363:134-1375(-)
MMRSDIRMVVCICAVLGPQVQVQALFHRTRAAAYYVADACNEPSEYVNDPAECDNAANELGLIPGILPSMTFGGYCAKWNGGGLSAMSPSSSSWYYHYANNQAGAKSICKQPYITASGSCPIGYAAISSGAECDAAGSALGYTPGPWKNTPYGGSCATWDGGFGSMGSAWYWYFASNQATASFICASVTAAPSATPSATPSPTPGPTPGPTPSPTPSPTSSPTPAPPTVAAAGAIAPASGPIGATGDPHLQNVHGERFDVRQPGQHVLISIPRGEPRALLRVVAEASRLGQQCSDMYFRALNVTGAWAEAKQAGGYHYRSESVADEAPEWIGLGKVELKVVHGRTDNGALYLNFYVKHLGRAGFAVGGLLGEDDHQDAETPPEECVQRISLLAGASDTQGHGSAPWVAVGSFE